MWSLQDVRSFCVSLNRRKDRWDRMIKQKEVHKIPNLERFSGVDGKTIDIATDTRISTICRKNILQKTRRSHDMLDSPGGVGCALSHMAIWNKLVKSQEQVFFIIEDDLVMKDGDWNRVVKLFNENEFLHDSNSWDIWSIGNLECDADPNKIFPDLRPKIIDNKWVQCKLFVGFNSYFITRRGAEKLLQEALPIQHHIDWFVAFYGQTHPDFKILYNRSFNLDQDDTLSGPGNSDIQTKNQCYICDVPSDYERSHFVFHKQDFQSMTVLSLMSVGLLVVGMFALRKKKIL